MLATGEISGPQPPSALQTPPTLLYHLTNSSTTNRGPAAPCHNIIVKLPPVGRSAPGTVCGLRCNVTFGLTTAPAAITPSTGNVAMFSVHPDTLCAGLPFARPLASLFCAIIQPTMSKSTTLAFGAGAVVVLPRAATAAAVCTMPHSPPRSILHILFPLSSRASV